MALSSLLRIPRPQKFFYLMSLRTGTSFIVLTVLINKISGLYGILALFTGYELSPLQFSMYIYSLFALGLAVYLGPHVRKQSPLQCLALAWFYALDSLINVTYTVFFALAWFWVLATQHSETTKAPGGKMIDETAGFTSPEHNVSQVEVLAKPAPGLQGQDAAAIGIGEGPAQPAASLRDALFQSGSMMSLILIITIWIVRVYFVLIVLSYARAVLRQHILMTSSSNFALHTGSESAELAENPFSEAKEEGQGWKGKLGRAFLSVGTEYWLGREEEDAEWIRSFGGKFESRKAAAAGPVERERRRRSGTGPPAPPPELPRFENFTEAR